MALLITYLLSALLISFLCSVLEAVLMSTPLSFVTMKEEEGLKSARLFKKYKQSIDRPIAAILSLNTIAHTVGAAGVGAQATILFGEASVGIVSAIVTFLILVFSEIMPKTIGTSYWKSLTTFTANTIRVLIIITFPLVILFEWITKLIAPKDQEITISREEVSAMANIGEEEGVFEKSENKIIQNLIKLDSIKAYDAMTPRVVSAIAPESMTLKDFYKDNTYLHHSRIPVYAETPEYITGYILRGVALEYLADDKFNVKLGEIKRDIAYFNEETAISDIWEALLKHKEQIALIIDEYGCFQGILTLEDIIETLLGLEIIDEKDEVSDMQQYARERWEQRQKKYKKINLPE
ncbi:MAG: CNNM domain-containing protein [Bacteroidales bacterium]|nr:CNNM domain-containing protein [Bacteroidales bacterium]MDD4670419.1 CNNM domain-containing protein [Bacteroidales bacterium]